MKFIKKPTEQDFYAALSYSLRTRRITHPVGQFDNAGRWYPSQMEHQPCCQKIRPPSRKWRYSLMTHCRTIIHCIHLYHADESNPYDIAEILQSIHPVRLQAGSKGTETTHPQQFIENILQQLRENTPAPPINLQECQALQTLIDWFALPLHVDWETELALAIIGGER